jgi:hypothetical protein
VPIMWAVDNTAGCGPLIMQWDGTRRRHVASAGMAGHDGFLFAAALSAGTATVEFGFNAAAVVFSRADPVRSPK